MWKKKERGCSSCEKGAQNYWQDSGATKFIVARMCTLVKKKAYCPSSDHETLLLTKPRRWRSVVFSSGQRRWAFRWKICNTSYNRIEQKITRKITIPNSKDSHSCEDVHICWNNKTANPPNPDHDTMLFSTPWWRRSDVFSYGQSRLAFRSEICSTSYNMGLLLDGPTNKSATDSDLETFSHNPTVGSLAPLALQPSAYVNSQNLHCLSYWAEWLLQQPFISSWPLATSNLNLGSYVHANRFTSLHLTFPIDILKCNCNGHHLLVR